MSQLIQFIKEAIEELKKVTWLSRPQMIASTWLVIIVVLIMSAYVWVVDSIIHMAFKLAI